MYIHLMSTNHKGCQIQYHPPPPPQRSDGNPKPAPGVGSLQLLSQFKAKKDKTSVRVAARCFGCCSTILKPLQSHAKKHAARQHQRQAEKKKATKKTMILRVGKWHRLEGSPSNTHMLEQKSPFVDLKPVCESTSLRVAPRRRRVRR